MPNRSMMLLALVLTGGCAQETAYPSLLPRAGERVGFDEPAAPPPAPVAADPVLDAKIATAQKTLGDAAARADAAITHAETLAAAAQGKPAGSDAWLNAQVALADLDALRSDGSATLTDLEGLASDRAATLAPDYPALTAAIDAARSAIETQTARIAAIQAKLAPA